MSCQIGSYHNFNIYGILVIVNLLQVEKEELLASSRFLPDLPSDASWTIRKPSLDIPPTTD